MNSPITVNPGEILSKDQVAVAVTDVEDDSLAEQPVSFMVEVAPGEWAEYHVTQVVRYDDYVEVRMQDGNMNTDQAGQPTP